MKRDENGYIVVETILCFTLLVFLMVSILSLINIVTVQARMHYALTQTAETVSMYCYALDKIGFAEPLMGIAEKAEKTQKEIDTFKGNIDDLTGALNSLMNSEDFDCLYESGKTIAQSGKGLYDQGVKLVNTDPKVLLQNFLSLSIDEICSYGFEQLLQALMDRYLTNGSLSGDEYLRAYGVIDGVDGLDFTPSNYLRWESRGNSNSHFLTSEGSVRIIVSYKIDYTFGTLPLPFSDLAVTQQAETLAWLQGEGEGYHAG